MSWRTVVVTGCAKIEYKLNYVVVRSECVKKIHVSEIHTLIIESTAVSMTAALLNELIKRKIKVIFCDEKYNPHSELSPFYGHSLDSGNIMCQIAWTDNAKMKVWGEIVKRKILSQAYMLQNIDSEAAQLLRQYADNICDWDKSNREGLAAKVYFSRLFGAGFQRGGADNINAALNYGYTVLLSAFNREIVAGGYMTQLGICHRNAFNKFNLGCDLMEPFRIFVDEVVSDVGDKELDREYKNKLIDILNRKVVQRGERVYLNNAVRNYVKSVFAALNGEDRNIDFVSYEL